MQGSIVLEPFRQSLGHAIQWCDILQVEIEKNIADILQGCWDTVSSARSYREPLSLLPSSPTKHDLSPGSCAPILVQCCPACFGGQDFRCLLDNGGDIHIAMDGNFHHRHRCSRGSGQEQWARAGVQEAVPGVLLGAWIDGARCRLLSTMG
ncbi:hypothetical protein EDC04DRAFT_2585850 [Pisolithus marmoratus]|nr:hypothetical protein EDC04DRAFT_2585850 [Pisolithus marmoratus]